MGVDGVYSNVVPLLWAFMYLGGVICDHAVPC